jgi:F0F1-type ATP synthase alpha subunit
MAEIKPAEISAIRKQVEGFESGATLEEVLQVGDGIARVYGLSISIR